jgi:hypothetical protein
MLFPALIPALVLLFVNKNAYMRPIAGKFTIRNNSLHFSFYVQRFFEEGWAHFITKGFIGISATKRCRISIGRRRYSGLRKPEI